jgi:ribosomal protein L39E
MAHDFVVCFKTINTTYEKIPNPHIPQFVLFKTKTMGKQNTSFDPLLGLRRLWRAQGTCFLATF